MAGGTVHFGAVLWLAALLVLPAVALYRLDLGIRSLFVTGGWGLVCLITYILYGNDKRRAETGRWRIPESTLHLMELAGGWAGAYLAQRTYRHKNAKISYQLVFWLIVFAYQLVAIDYLNGWNLSKSAVLLIKTRGH